MHIQMVKKFLHCMKAESSLQCSQTSSLESVQNHVNRTQILTPNLTISPYIIFPFSSQFPLVVSSFKVPRQQFLRNFHLTLTIFGKDNKLLSS